MRKRIPDAPPAVVLSILGGELVERCWEDKSGCNHWGRLPSKKSGKPSRYWCVCCYSRLTNPYTPETRSKFDCYGEPIP